MQKSILQLRNKEELRKIVLMDLMFYYEPMGFYINVNANLTHTKFQGIVKDDAQPSWQQHNLMT